MKPVKSRAIELQLPPDPPISSAFVETGDVLDARPWLDMSTAPHDGTLVELAMLARAHEPKIITAKWRITRRRIDRQWQVVGFWANPQTMEEIGETPQGWRMPDGYLYPGMVVG